MQREVDISLGILIKKILMGELKIIPPREKIQEDLLKGINFWREVVSVFIIKNKNTNEFLFEKLTSLVQKADNFLREKLNAIYPDMYN